MEQSSLTLRPNSAPPAPTTADDLLLIRCQNAIEKIPGGGLSISDQRAPTGADRAALERRLAALALPDSRNLTASIAARVSRLFLRFPASGQADDAQVAAYVADLVMLPLWAIDKGILRAIAKGGQYAPSSPILRQLCEDELAPIRAEAAAIKAVLEAQVYHEPTETEREEINRRFQELLGNLKLNAPLDPMRPKEQRPPTRKEAEEWLEREKATPRCPDPSPALRAILGLPEMQRQEDAA
jgi:hypothetical protein